MRFLGIEIRKARPHGQLAYYRMRNEARTRSATKKFTFGNIQGNIYSPYDDETGETRWRFSLVKLCGRKENGEQVYRKSFEIGDADDLHYAVARCVQYIVNAEEL